MAGRPKKGNELSKRERALTDLQREFCVNYVYLCEFDAKKAVEMTYKKEGSAAQSNICHKERELMNDDRIRDYITELVEQRDSMFIVDKLFVIKKLKGLVETGAENIQLKALELLGKTMSMFSDRQEVVDVGEDPAKLAKEAFSKRFKQEENLVPFTGTDGDTDD